jgi:hypothetical protein
MLAYTLIRTIFDLTGFSNLTNSKEAHMRPLIRIATMRAQPIEFVLSLNVEELLS